MPTSVFCPEHIRRHLWEIFVSVPLGVTITHKPNYPENGENGCLGWNPNW